MAGENQFNVRWNDHAAVLLQSITQKLEQSEFTDVVLACEGETLKCHRLILSACSPYFAKILEEIPTPNMVIFLKDTKFWELEALVNFMYRGEITVTQEKLGELCSAAEILKVRGLAKDVDSGASYGINGGVLQDVEQPLDYNNIRDMVMVDLLHYGNSGEANQKQRPAPGAHNPKSLLRQSSNMPPATRKLQEFIKRKQQTPQEAPKQFKLPKVGSGRQSSGNGAPSKSNGSDVMKVKAHATSTKSGPSQPSSGLVGGGFNGGNVVDTACPSLQNGTAINPAPKMRVEGTVNYAGAHTTPDVVRRNRNQNLETEEVERTEFMNPLLQVNIADSTTKAMTSAMKTSPSASSTEGNKSSRSSTPSPPTSGNGMGPPMDAVGRMNLLEQAANRAVLTRNIRQAAMEYEIPRSTLNAFMKRKNIVVRPSETQDDFNNENPAMSGDLSNGSDRDHDQVKSMIFTNNLSGENGSAITDTENFHRMSCD